MLRRLMKPAFQAQDEHPPLKKMPAREQPPKLDHLEPPTVKNVTHHSVELEWKKPSWSSNHVDNKMKFTLQEEDRKTKGTGTVYIGYGLSHLVSGLDPMQSYRYRLKVTDSFDQVLFSPYVTVQTTKEPYNGQHLHKAILQENTDLVLKILSSQEVSIEVTDDIGYTPLMNACQKKVIDIVNTLLEHGADVDAENSSGKNSLMVACFGGSLEIVKRLNMAGASWNCADRGGSTPMHWAVDSGNSELVEWMISVGCDVNVRDSGAGWTPLLRCCIYSGNVEMARLLIRNGADVNIADNDGKTALMSATLGSHTDLVKELVEHGADFKFKNKYGKCAIDMARSFDRRKILSYFEELVQQQES